MLGRALPAGRTLNQWEGSLFLLHSALGMHLAHRDPGTQKEAALARSCSSV